MAQEGSNPKLAEKILHEVKAQGVFDQFRKDSVADVDTKPAYQNLTKRVENTVQKFLSEQKWTPETNKYQLREKLRRHIVESGFFDVGVERIVDQVVNPKIKTVFQPRIEEIAYKYFGVSPPLPTTKIAPPPPPPLPMSLPPLPPCPPMDDIPPLKVETNISNDLLPKDLEQISPDSDKMKDEDLSDGGIMQEKADDDDESPPFEPLTECKSPKAEVKLEEDEISSAIVAKKEIVDKVVKQETIKKENDVFLSYESQLSQVSSDSRLSSISNQLLNNGNETETVRENADANISEEAQMPRFNENSTGTECSVKSSTQLHFDIKKDAIKFEGTERKANILNGDVTESNAAITASIEYGTTTDNSENKGTFHFTKLDDKVGDSILNSGAVSSISSQDDTTSAQLCIVERPDDELLSVMNSIQKSNPQEDSSTNATISNNNSQIKQQSHNKSDKNGKQSSASSSCSSRPKNSSSMSFKDRSHHQHSSEKYRKHSEKERHKSKHHERDRERDKDRDRDRQRDRDRDRIRDRERDRYHDTKHSSKVSSSNSSSRRHDKHKSSSRHIEKEQHVSSTSRSESRSHHKSSKRDRHDKHEHKKSHKSSSSSKKEHRSEEEQKSRTNDDHNESREKRRWRKSTDSNDEDKNPKGHPNANQTVTEHQNTNEQQESVNVNKTNETEKNCKETTKDTSQDDKLVDNDNSSNISESIESKNSRVVILDAVLENPQTNFVDIENILSIVQSHKMRENSPTHPSDSLDDSDLLYFEQTNDEHIQTRLNLLNEAIDRCRTVINADIYATNPKAKHHNSEDINNDEISTLMESTCHNEDTRIENESHIKHEETKATLLIDCFHYSECNGRNSIENMNTTSKRMRFTTDSNCSKIPEIPSIHNTKLNQMKEKNSIMTDEDSKKPTTLSKRLDTMAKLSQQQRYSSEDLYKPRPVVGQRSKRRGVDTIM